MTDAMHGKPAVRSFDRPSVVDLSQRDIDDARRLLSLLASGGSDTPGEAGAFEAHSPHHVSSQSLPMRARDILANRRRRHDIFGKAMFGEPAWEALLTLYVFESGPRQTASRIADLIGASKTTTLRWLDYLDGQGLIHRVSHPTDRRTAFVALTVKGKEAVELYLSDTLPTGE